MEQRDPKVTPALNDTFRKGSGDLIEVVGTSPGFVYWQTPRGACGKTVREHFVAWAKGSELIRRSEVMR